MAERTAEEWGRLAVSLPGWRWMPGMLAQGPMGAWRTGELGALGGSWPDPDDPATAGCLLALLGTGASINATGGQVTAWLRVDGTRVEGSGTNIGRACIATAEALGRWPGGAQ